jgi:hypothetical protein
MTHAELQDLAQDHCLEVIIFPNLEPALVGYIWDQALDGSDTIRAVYDHDKILDCLVQQGMSDEEANEWFNTQRTTDQFEATRKHPTFIYTHQ